MTTSSKREAAFIGRITAGITHELRNILAIIKETSGLVEDLLAMCERGQAPDRERTETALGTIRQQVTRGVDLIQHLNRLAHTPDEAVVSASLNQHTAQIAALTQRFARQKGALLSARAAEADAMVRTDPLALQMALFAAIECGLKHLPARGELTLEPAMNGKSAVVEFLCREQGGESPAALGAMIRSDDWRDVSTFVDGFGWSMEADESAGCFRLALTDMES